ncbi:hypothetical protein [Rhodohalobacter sp. 8-1]|uniref:hypothetical protein n=1 Tax=Rhodohalobacter sp. 8-1 TaxID=3131972 RepID=UPI0030EB4C04
MKRLYILIFLLFGLAASPAYSQFEGEILFNLEQYQPNRTESSQFKLTALNNRIFISSQKDVDVVTGLKSNGLLVRNDLQDFVFNTGENQALKVSKSDLDGLMNMIERFSGSSSKSNNEQLDWKNRIIETDNVKQHLGYDVQEFRLLGENINQYVSIWLTQDIKVIWGLMTDVWNRAGNRFIDSEFPIELIMNSNSFPMLVEVFDNGQLVAKFESLKVETNNFDRSVVELSEQKRLVGLTELMMNMFRQQ